MGVPVVVVKSARTARRAPRPPRQQGRSSQKVPGFGVVAIKFPRRFRFVCDGREIWNARLHPERQFVLLRCACASPDRPPRDN